MQAPRSGSRRSRRRSGADAPDREQVDRLLRLAAVAAHSSERTAGAIACWIAGARGVDIERAIEIAEGLGGDSG